MAMSPVNDAERMSPPKRLVSLFCSGSMPSRRRFRPARGTFSPSAKQVSGGPGNPPRLVFVCYSTDLNRNGLGEGPLMTEAAPQREKRLRESHLQHAALAQLHLWLQHHDAAAGGLTAHFLRASDIQLRSGGAIAID